MKFRRKSWVWYVTIFAAKNYTAIWNTVYGPMYPSSRTWRHEEIHSRHQKAWTWAGAPLWFGLYLLGLPLFFNPLRYYTEYTAFTEGSGYGHQHTVNILSGWRYGWMPWWLHFWVVQRKG